MMRVPLTPLVFVCALPLAGCAGASSQYPTLEIRPGERVTGSFVPPSGDSNPMPAPVASADLLDQLGELRNRASSAHAGFQSAAPRARTLANAAAGSEVGSDAWAQAQVALADLDSARSLSAIALGDLDILYLDARLTGGARQEIDESRNAVLAILEEEDQVLAELRGVVR